VPVKKQGITKACGTITMAHILQYTYLLIKSPPTGLWRAGRKTGLCDYTLQPGPGLFQAESMEKGREGMGARPGAETGFCTGTKNAERCS
jgi:hypothetical protein